MFRWAAKEGGVFRLLQGWPCARRCGSFLSGCDFLALGWRVSGAPALGYLLGRRLQVSKRTALFPPQCSLWSPFCSVLEPEVLGPALFREGNLWQLGQWSGAGGSVLLSRLATVPPLWAPSPFQRQHIPAWAPWGRSTGVDWFAS